MLDKKYVIEGDYHFEVISDGARPASCDTQTIHLALTHDEVMDMGKYFIDHEPSEVEDGHDFGLKDRLDNMLVESIVDEIREEMEEEQMDSDDEDDARDDPEDDDAWDDSEDDDDAWDDDDDVWDDDDDDDVWDDDGADEDDLYDMAYDRMDMMYHTWSECLVKECKEYYLTHRDLC